MLGEPGIWAIPLSINLESINSHQDFIQIYETPYEYLMVSLHGVICNNYDGHNHTGCHHNDMHFIKIIDLLEI